MVEHSAVNRRVAGSSPARGAQESPHAPLGAFMFYVYILRSESSGRYYIGQSGNPELRLEYHNTIEKGFTARYRPWRLVWKKGVETREEAKMIEARIKRRKDRNYVEKIVAGEILV